MLLGIDFQDLNFPTHLLEEVTISKEINFSCKYCDLLFLNKQVANQFTVCFI